MLGRLAPGVALASMAALVLVGCSPAAPEPTADSPTPSDSASAEGRLEDMRATWDEYQSTLSALAADPESASIEPLLTVSTPEVAETQFANIEEAAAVGARVEGSRITTAFEPMGDTGLQDMVVAVCVDTNGEQVLDFEGEPIPRNPEELLRSQVVEFVWDASEGTHLVASDRDYDGEPESDPCAS